jgi:hypothetical protein
MWGHLLSKEDQAKLKEYDTANSITTHAAAEGGRTIPATAPIDVTKLPRLSAKAKRELLSTSGSTHTAPTTQAAILKEVQQAAKHTVRID